MKKRDILILTSAVITALSLVTATTVYAQVQLPPQAAPQAQQNAGPSEAQKQADIANAMNTPQGQAVSRIKDQVNSVLDQAFKQAGPTGKAHATVIITNVLANLVKAGLLTCPTPIDPVHPNCQVNVPHTPGMPTPPKQSFANLAPPPR